RIAQALGARLPDLLAPARALRSVRFRAQKKMARREQVIIQVATWLEDYAELEELLDKKVEFPLDKLKKTLQRRHLGEARAKAAASEARDAMGRKPDEVIRDICGLLEDYGIKVYPIELASDGFFGLSVAEEDGGPAVVVNTWDRISVERWIFTA